MTSFLLKFAYFWLSGAKKLAKGSVYDIVALAANTASKSAMQSFLGING